MTSNIIYQQYNIKYSKNSFHWLLMSHGLQIGYTLSDTFILHNKSNNIRNVLHCEIIYNIRFLYK